jgi:hypothetical protein
MLKLLLYRIVVKILSIEILLFQDAVIISPTFSKLSRQEQSASTYH